MRLVVIADDLTGALDSAVEFAISGFRTVCARTVDDLDAALALGADVVAVSTGSRELPETEAVAKVAKVDRQIGAFPQVVLGRAWALVVLVARAGGEVVLAIRIVAVEQAVAVVVDAISTSGAGTCPVEVVLAAHVRVDARGALGVIRID